ncbi:MAG: GDSL-type esterase/lipase family protein [Luteolibacter sp.]|jgi:acyl-CoA thioesterase I
MSPIKMLFALLALAPAFATASPITLADFDGPIRVACVGDSITQGSGTRGNSYPKQLQQLLGDAWNIGNFGVSGRTLLRKGDHPYWDEKAYQNALEFQPHVVIIKLGTNDTKPQNFKHEADFQNDLRDLAKSFLQLESKPRVYLCRPVPVIGQGNFKITEENLQKLMPHIDTVAKELELGIIDMYAALDGKPELIPDRVHPNAEGAGVMAKAAFISLTGKPAPVE